jgi:hypothetical protein
MRQWFAVSPGEKILVRSSKRAVPGDGRVVGLERFYFGGIYLANGGADSPWDLRYGKPGH